MTGALLYVSNLGYGIKGHDFTYKPNSALIAAMIAAEVYVFEDDGVIPALARICVLINTCVCLLAGYVRMSKLTVYVSKVLNRSTTIWK